MKREAAKHHSSCRCGACERRRERAKAKQVVAFKQRQMSLFPPAATFDAWDAELRRAK